MKKRKYPYVKIFGHGYIIALSPDQEFFIIHEPYKVWKIFTHEGSEKCLHTFSTKKECIAWLNEKFSGKS